MVEATVRLAKLQELWEKFEEIQVQLNTKRQEDDELFQADQNEGEEIERIVFENSYYQAAAKAQAIINTGY